jgi:hypothetical protein
MSIIRRITAVMLTTLVVGGFMTAVPAHAADTETLVTAPEAFVSSASALGLDINLFGTRVTVGASTAGIDSSPKAQAQGAGVAIINQSIARAEAIGIDRVQTPPSACALNVPLLGLATVATACGQAAASTTGGLPQASSSGAVAAIDLGGSLLTPLLNAVGALVGTTVGQVVDPLTTLLGGLLQPLLQSLNLTLNNTVDQLLEGLRRATSLLTIEAGTSAAQATTSAAKVNSLARAQGAVIKLLPGLSPLGAPLATITVGDAIASVDVTRAAPNQGGPAPAVATPAFQAALVRVQLGIPVLGNLTDIPVGLGSPLVLLAGTPLESRISVGAGSTGDGPNGTKFAVADGVSLDLLRGLTPNGGISISLAHAEAAAGGRSAVITVRQINNPVPQAPIPELARTGGQAGWIPMIGGALLLLAYATRRVAVGSRRP